MIALIFAALPALALAQTTISLVSTTATGCATLGSKTLNELPFGSCTYSPLLSTTYGQGTVVYIKPSTPSSSSSSVTVLGYADASCTAAYQIATITIPSQGTYASPMPYVPSPTNPGDLLIGAFSDQSKVIITTCGASSSSGGSSSGGSSVPTTCSACTGTSYFGSWCNGVCYTSIMNCPASSLTSGCSAYNAATCSSYPSSCPTSSSTGSGGGGTTGGTTDGTTGGTTGGGSSLPTTCSACVGSYYWCEGKCYANWNYGDNSVCAKTIASCYADSSYRCSSYSCSTTTSTGGSSTGTGGSVSYPSSADVSLLTGISGLDQVDDAKKAATAGVAASVVAGFVFALLIITTSCCCKRTPPPSATGQLWKARAATAATTISVGVFFQALGLVTGLAAPAIPWFSYTYSILWNNDLCKGYNCIFSATTLTYKDITTDAQVSSSLGVLVGGAIIAYIGLIGFLFPALLMAWSALYRLVTVSKFGGGPVTPIGCCLPSLPAIQGLSWVGMIIFLVGAAWDWALFGVIRVILLAGGVGPGGSLMAASFACLLIAALCYSVAGCCQLGNFPGVGTSRTNCCGPEKDENAIPSEAYKAPVPGLKLQAVNVGSAV